MAIEILEYGGRREGSLGSAEDNDINDKLDDIGGSAELLEEDWAAPVSKFIGKNEVRGAKVENIYRRGGI
jgi:hypothetical protein